MRVMKVFYSWIKPKSRHTHTHTENRIYEITQFQEIDLSNLKNERRFNTIFTGCWHVCELFWFDQFHCYARQIHTSKTIQCTHITTFSGTFLSHQPSRWQPTICELFRKITINNLLSHHWCCFKANASKACKLKS